MGLLQKWNKYKGRRWFQGIIIGIICFLLGCGFSYWLVYHSISIQESRFQENLKMVEPNISVSIREKGPSELSIRIIPNKDQATEVKSLRLRFNIPGKYKEIKPGTYTSPIDNCRVSVFPTSPIYDEAILECNSFQQISHYEIFLEYEPFIEVNNKYLNKWIDAGELPIEVLNYSIPFVGFYDYAQVEVSWDFESMPQIQKWCLNMTKLSFIEIDSRAQFENNLKIGNNESEARYFAYFNPFDCNYIV